MDEYGAYLLLFVALYAAAQFWLVWRVRGRTGRPAPRLDDVLDARRLEQPRLILYFWRPGCPLCGPTSMIVEPLLDQRRDIVRINILEATRLARRLGISGAPALVVIDEGRIERILVGSRNEQQIRELVGAWPDADDEAED